MLKGLNVVLKQRTRLRCPSCHTRVAASKFVFREKGARCARCGNVLRVSSAYARGLVILSMMIGFLFLWIAGVRNPVRFCLFWTPAWLLILTVAVRVAPFLLPPTLVTREPGHVTTLGLGDVEENRHEEH